MMLPYRKLVWFGGLLLAAFTLVVCYDTFDKYIKLTTSQYRKSNSKYLSHMSETETEDVKSKMLMHIKENNAYEVSTKQISVNVGGFQSEIVDLKQTPLKQMTEVRHVAFLKVHKTASSTAQNVFLRFGESRKLNFVLPHTKGESGFPNVISFNHSVTDGNIVPPPDGEHFDILCCHVLYNRKQFEKILPLDTAYIGIVREPVDRFQSAVKFFSPKYIMNIPGPNPLSTYVQNPTKYDFADPKLSRTNNRMAIEFGFPENLFPGKSLSGNIEGINMYLEKLDKEFKFVIISERFDESMVLMKRLFNWKLKDVLYLEKNKGRPNPNPKKILLEKDKVLVKKFLYLDIALYDWATSRFRKQKDAEGGDFVKELAFFRKIRDRLKEFCKSRQISIFVEKTHWNEDFSITQTDCADFYTREKNMILRQRMRMYGVDEN